MAWSAGLCWSGFILLVQVSWAQLDVPFFMPRLATNLMGDGRPEAGSLESMDALSQYPCYGNACERLNRASRDGWDAGNPGAVGATGRRTTTAPPVPRTSVPDPQVLTPSRTGPSSMFVDGEVLSVAQERPSLQNAISLEEPVMIEDFDETKFPSGGTTRAFPTAVSNARTEGAEPSEEEPIFPAKDTTTSFPLSADAAQAEAARIQRLRQAAAVEAAWKAYAARMAPGPAPWLPRRASAHQEGSRQPAASGHRSVIGVNLGAVPQDFSAGRRLRSFA